MTIVVPAILVVFYLGYAGLAFALQRSLIFPRRIANQMVSSDPAPPIFETWWLELGDGQGRVEAWYARAPRASGERPGPAVIYFHGNGELIEHSTHVAALYLERDISVLLVEYRGYGRSGGLPSEEGVTNDAVAFRDRLSKRPEIDSSRIIYHGRSLGGGAACALAQERPPAGLVLESTFSSVQAMTARYLLPGFVCRHPFRSDLLLETFDRPVLLMHGTEDHLIPHHHSQTLHAIAPKSTLVLLPGGHNDFPRDEVSYERAIDEFLGGVLETNVESGS